MIDHVPLDRQFIRWNGDRDADVDLNRWFAGIETSFDWEALTDRRRVVILAEAGSGKSTELREQAKRLVSAGHACFITTLQRIGQKGSLEGALGKIDWRRFVEWKATGDPCWLLLDSVDEAKRADFSLFDILSDVADAIEGINGRVHLVLSGRVSDWEFKRDLATLLERIPIPPPDEKLEPVTPDQALIAAVNREKPKDPEPVELPLVVAMAALDPARVEIFARAKGTTNVDRMLAELEKQHLWSFARRPTDLDWLVGFWQARGMFGTLQEMLDLSVSERLKETNISRARKDELDADKARSAVERIGAALVLQRLDTIVVPDTNRETREDVAYLDLKDIIPDLSPAEQHAFINRPIFDPATPGFIRLHNDNEGEVRGFLAAKWMYRLRRTGNLAISRIFELLFANTYGICLVKPSMRATAAWLSLWEPEVAQEVLARDPRLLMDAGDPAGLSLEIRVKALDAMISLAKQDEHFAVPNQDALRRFAQEDLESFIQDRWATIKGLTGPRVLLLLLIQLGGIKACANIAAEATQGGHADRYTPIFAGRALLGTGDADQLRTYIEYLIAHAKDASPSLIWDALEALYPTFATTVDLLALVRAVQPRGEDGGLDIDYYGPRLALRIPDKAAAEAVVRGLFDMLEVKVDLFGETSKSHDERLLETLEVAAARYAEFTPRDELPTIIVDAALRIGESRRKGRRGSRTRHLEAPNLEGEINVSPERRRRALWRCAEVFRGSKEVKLHSPWQLRFIGFAPSLEVTDVEWLLEDVATRTDEDDLRLATNGALAAWRQAGSDQALLTQISTANLAAVVQETIDAAITPAPADNEFARAEAEHREWVERDAIEEAKKDQSWIDFRNELEKDPRSLTKFYLPENGNVDNRLYHLWRLLNGLGDNQSRYAIGDIAPIRKLFGDSVADAFQEAMIAYWRYLETKLPSEMPPEERRSSHANDLMGLVGVTLEAGTNRGWARALDEDKARKATRFATRELNGFPRWLDDLAIAHPKVVEEILWQYLEVDLQPSNEEHLVHLQHVAGASDPIAKLMAPRMQRWVEHHAEVPLAVLNYALDLITRSPDALANAMPTIGRRCLEPRGRDICAAYFGAAYAHDAETATGLLLRAFDALAPKDQALLAQAALPRAFGSRFGHRGYLNASSVPFTSLERLVMLAFEKVRPDADNHHPSLEAYSPDERDHAEDVRSALFNTLVSTPGYATFAAIQRFRDVPEFPVWDSRLRKLAFDRAATDSEPTPMRAHDVLIFERYHDLVPATSADLQRVGIARLSDIEHSLLHGDFNQGLTVARLPKEVDVQNWFAHALSARAGHGYSVEREPHVADEKEPDIRLTSLRDPKARCPIEIKVAGSWSLEQLEEALTVQLKGRYLRDRENRFGVLLIVHNTVRRRGWPRDGNWLTFGEVLEHLRTLAGILAAVDALAPQMIAVGIDLSDFAERIAAEDSRSKGSAKDESAGSDAASRA
jgi:hypothetical protein